MADCPHPAQPGTASQRGRKNSTTNQERTAQAATAPDPAPSSAALRRALLATCSQPEPGLSALLASLALQFDGNSLCITFPHAYFGAYYHQRWQTTLETLARAAFGSHIHFLYGAKASPPVHTLPMQDNDAFANFLVNAKSAMAIAALREACSATNQSPWLLVIICGPCGSGKSTLLAACQAALSASMGAGATHFLTGTSFQPDLSPETFWNRHRVLIVDDCQQAPPAILAACLDAGKRADTRCRAFCAFTGSSADINKLDRHIASRFRAGLILELPTADLAMRLAYAEKHAAGFCSASKRQLLQLARFAQNIPALAGLLQKMEFYGRVTNQTLSPEALATLTLPEQEGKLADWQLILAQVAETTRIKPADILSPSRKHEIVLARMTAMYLCRNRLGLSYQEIGRIFGGRNHAAVIYAIRKIEELRKVDKVTHNLLTKLEGQDLI